MCLRFFNRHSEVAIVRGPRTRSVQQKKTESDENNIQSYRLREVCHKTTGKEDASKALRAARRSQGANKF